MAKHRERARYLRRSAGSFQTDDNRHVDYDNHVFEIFGGRVKVSANGDVPVPALSEGEECELVYEGIEFRPVNGYLIPAATLVEIVSAGNLKAAV